MKLPTWYAFLYRFRHSRIALLLDHCLLPILVPIWILVYGLPTTIRELRDQPRWFKECWSKYSWSGIPYPYAHSKQPKGKTQP